MLSPILQMKNVKLRISDLSKVTQILYSNIRFQAQDCLTPASELVINKHTTSRMEPWAWETKMLHAPYFIFIK